MVAFVIFLLCLAICPAEEAAKTDFLRVKEEGENLCLQTAITTYQKEEQRVTLIGAVHLADQDYYVGLNERFKIYDCILFEMIGGEKAAEAQESSKPAVGIAKMYQVLATFLKLAEQREVIDYSAKNFVHADLTSEEFKKLQDEKGETLLDFGKKESGKSNPKFQKLMDALLSGDANKVKLQLIGDLGKGDDQIDAFAGKSVIIHDRNAKALQVLKTAVEKGNRNIGIFYGAAHFPDLEKSLVERGFKKGEQKWLNAWTVQRTQ